MENLYRKERVNRKMADLVDMVIDDYIMPKQISIETVARECFEVYEHNYQAATYAFGKQIPNKIPQVSSDLVKSLANIFDNILYQLSIQNE